MLGLKGSSLCCLTVLVALSLGPKVAAAKPPSALQLMNQVENRNQGKDMISVTNLEILPKHGVKRLRRFVVMRKEYPSVTKLVTFFQVPEDVRNSAFLVFDRKHGADQRWIYLPAIGQVRQVAARDSRGSFFGSDFVYEDLTNRDPDQDSHKLVGTQKVGTWDCWVVDSTPKDGSHLDFARYRTWVWKTEPMIIRQEYYDRTGKPIRRGQLKSMKKIQGIWTPLQLVVFNLRTGSQSRLEASNVHYNTGVTDERFVESQLSRGAPKPN